ncbi:hypothetical protein KM043_002148 [Ampulex compressa]|nr:hypothetical protein KM043_002148 [Ampulex compressa]
MLPGITLLGGKHRGGASSKEPTIRTLISGEAREISGCYFASGSAECSVRSLQGRRILDKVDLVLALEVSGSRRKKCHGVEVYCIDRISSTGLRSSGSWQYANTAAPMEESGEETDVESKIARRPTVD